MFFQTAKSFIFHQSFSFLYFLLSIALYISTLFNSVSFTGPHAYIIMTVSGITES